MEDLNEKKEEQRKKERGQAQLHHSWQMRIWDDYYAAANERNLDEVQFGFNISMLMEILQGWAEKVDQKTKPDQYKKLMAMRTACVEMLTHQMSLRQKLSWSIMESKKWEQQWKLQTEKNKLLEEELNALKSQQQFNEEN